MHHELACGPLKDALQHVTCNLALGLLGRKACFIDVGTLCFVSAHRVFCGHNLQEFQDGRVSEGLLFTQRLMDFTHGGRTPRPKDGKNLKLRCSRFVGVVSCEGQDYEESS